MISFSTMAETTAEVITEVAGEATEAVTYTIPDGYNLSAKIATPTLITQMLTSVVILGVMIMLFVYVRKKQKDNMFCFVGGIATYLVFFYFGWRAVYYLYYIPGLTENADSVPIYVALFTVVPALIGTLGRVLCMAIYKSNGQRASIHINVGLGLLAGMAVYAAANTFFDFVNCYYINNSGLEDAANALMSTSASQEAFENTFKELYAYTISTPWDYIVRGLDNVLLMFYHLAVTIPILVAFQNKETKLWYLYAFGSYAVILLVKNLQAVAGLPSIVSLLIEAAAVALTIFLARRMYKDYYQSEEHTEEPKKPEPPKKKMPKFENLSNL